MNTNVFELNRTIRDLKEMNDRLGIQNNTLTDDAKSLMDNMQHLEYLNLDCNRKLHDLKTKYSLAVTTVKKQATEIGRLNVELNNVTKDKNNFEQAYKFANKRNISNEEQSSHNATINRYETRIVELRNVIDSKTTECRKLRECISEMEDTSNDSYEKRIADLKADRANVITQLDNYTIQTNCALHNKDIDIEHLTINRQGWIDSYNDLMEKYNNLSTNFNRLNDSWKTQRVLNPCTCALNQVEEMTETNKRLGDGITMLGDQLKNKEEENYGLRRTVKTLEDQLKKIKYKLANSESQEATIFRNRFVISNLKRSLDHYDAKYDEDGNLTQKENIWNKEVELGSMRKNAQELIKFRAVTSSLGDFVDCRVFKQGQPTRKGLCLSLSKLKEFNYNLNHIIPYAEEVIKNDKF